MAQRQRDVERQRRAFSDRVRDLRTKAGLSQEALADVAALHRTYEGSVERGERNISLDNIYVMAKALGVPAASLLTADSASLRLGSGLPVGPGLSQAPRPPHDKGR